mgnify:CR=1 FL=1
MKALLIAAMIIYALVAIFIAQYMYVTVITTFEANKGVCTKKITTKFKLQAVLSGMFFPVSLTILFATILAKKHLGIPAQGSRGKN